MYALVKEGLVGNSLIQRRWAYYIFSWAGQHEECWPLLVLVCSTCHFLLAGFYGE